MNSNSLNKQKGIALLAVLAVSVALSLLITSATVMMQRQLNIGETAKQQFNEKAAAYKKSQQIGYLAATQRLSPAGISQGINAKAYERQDGRWTNIITGDELRVDGFIYAEEIDGVKLRYSLQAENGLPALNDSSHFWLRKWLSALGKNEFEINKLIHKLHDYADEDDWAMPSGAESFAYRKKQLPPPTQFLLQSCSELFHVIDWPDLLDANASERVPMQCSLLRTPALNINALPLQLWQILWPATKKTVAQNRRNSVWIYNESMLGESLFEQTIPSENIAYYPGSSFIVTIFTEHYVKSTQLDRGNGAAQPLVRKATNINEEK